MDKVINDIKDQISENKVLLFMKGSPYQPQCGFSAKVTQILFSYDVEFSYIDVLEFLEVRANLPKDF
jgi:Glutaredoxin-related protein